MEDGDLVRYIGKGHSILVHDVDYKVHCADGKGLQVFTNTGFVGLPLSEFILSKIGK